MIKKKVAKKMGRKEVGEKLHSTLDDMMDYESGKLDEKGTKRLFQNLVNSGQAWHLQGMYGRAANDMLESGFIKKPKNTGGKDTYGNPLKSYYANKK